MNPYQFVPFCTPAERKPIATHEKIDGKLHSGVLQGHIKTLTELFVSGPQERVARDQHQTLRFCRDGEVPIIPGSSLKGSIRSVFEALSGSCLPLAGDSRRRRVNNNILSYWERKRQHDYRVPDGFAPCGMRKEFENEKKACPACRVFGLLTAERVHLGRVHFSDAQLVSASGMQEITLEPFGAPGPRHRPFYGTPASGTKMARGRKFYFHRIQGARTTSEKTGQNKTVEACLPGAVFDFSVEYQGLREEELVLLIYSLILEEPMRHKIGMGKGVGLGSVEIKITAWQKLHFEQRYSTPGGGLVKVPDDQLETELQNARERYHKLYSNARDAFEALRDIWTWDESNPRDPQYPSFMWFKENPNVILEEVPEDAGQYKVRRTHQAGGQARPATHSGVEKPIDDSQIKKLQKELAKQKGGQQEALGPYKNRDVVRALIHKIEKDKIEVSLPEIQDRQFTVKRKNPYRPYQVGAKIRVRVFVDISGEISKVEEV